MQWSEARGQATQTHESCTIPSRGDLADEHGRLLTELRRAQQADEELNRDPVGPEIAQRIRDLEDEIAASEWTFVFRGVGRRPYRRMLLDHPATDEQVERLKADDMVALFDDDTFPPALLAASCVRVFVRATEESIEGVDWKEIWDTWSTGQVTRLWRACMAANTGVADTPKSVAASAVMAASAPS